MGTSISDEQVALLVEAKTKMVTVLFDGDDAGQESADTVVVSLARRLFVRAASLPVDADPASAGKEDVLALVEPVGVFE